ncbi:MAG: hypothetical protein ACFFCO_08350 [Promethearchaeota archaeon]
MSSANVPWKVRSALLSFLTEDFVVQKCRQLPSRRNIVLHITGTFSSTHHTSEIVVKWFQQPGIANEVQMLRDAYSRRIPVPFVIGSTAHVLLMHFVPGENLCDLITAEPKSRYGILLGTWLASYHQAFQRNSHPEKVLLKGDARIRNFICNGSVLVGVDFEECVVGHYLQDLASACASILDTDPLFTPKKLILCRTLLERYSLTRRISNPSQLVQEAVPVIIDTLKMTANRRGNPPILLTHIHQFEEGALHF